MNIMWKIIKKSHALESQHGIRLSQREKSDGYPDWKNYYFYSKYMLLSGWNSRSKHRQNYT